MKRCNIFTVRNIKEFLRDPLSYIFCLGFPIVMLIIMSIVNSSIPAEAGLDIFKINNLAGGIAIFGLTFTMLFTSIQVAKDRGGSFLIRLYATPMKSSDFSIGYMLPVLLIGIAQIIVCFVSSYIASVIMGETLSIPNLLLTIPVTIIPIIMFISVGMFFGSLLSDKAAPGICSIIISLSSMLGGIFMDVDSLGGVIYKVCYAMPFYHAVKIVRAGINGNLIGLTNSFLILLAYTVVFAILATFAFRSKMKADLN